MTFVLCAIALTLLHFATVSVSAQQPSSYNQCNAPGNLVQNCGFDQGFSDYQVNAGFTSTQEPSAQGATGPSLYTGPIGQDGTITQRLVLQPLGRYKISFDLGSNNFGPSNHLAIVFDGITLFNLQGSKETTTKPSGQTEITQTGVFYHREYLLTVKDTQVANLQIQVRAQNDPSYLFVDNIAVVYVGAGAIGDPQFTGFFGQSYQVHGFSDQIYNVISSSHLQYNALFKYLDHGSCRKGTECFAHPGNYFGQVGVLIKSGGEFSDASPLGFHSRKLVDAHAFGGSTQEGHEPESSGHQNTQLTITAGSVDQGMSVMMGNMTLKPSNAHVKLSQQSSLFFPSRFEFYIETVDFTIKLENSDNFLNQGVSINEDLVKQIKAYQSSGIAEQVSVSDLPHGLLGQTWETKTYDNKWKYIQGTLNEYIVADGLLGDQFKYNRF